MWRYMENRKTSVFVKTYEDGIKRVMEGNYAFLMESTMLDYAVQRDCNLTQIGGLLDSKGYGIATPKGSPWRDKISLAILELQEKGIIQILYDKWWKNTGDVCNRDDKSKESKANALGVENIGGVFVVLLCGLALAVVVAIFEFCWNSKKNLHTDNQSLCSEMAEELRFAMHCQGSKSKQRPALKRDCLKCAPGSTYVPTNVTMPNLGNFSFIKTRSVDQLTLILLKMDSKVVTSANETKSEQPEVVIGDAGEKVLERAEGSVVGNDQATTTTTTVVVIKNENVKPVKEFETDPQIEKESEALTTTTDVVTKKENECTDVPDKEGGSATAMTTTIVVAKNEPDPADISDKESKTSTTTTLVVSPKGQEDIETEEQVTESSSNADALSNANETANEADAKGNTEIMEGAVVVEEAEEDEEGEDEEEEEAEVEQEESGDGEDDVDGDNLEIGTKKETKDEKAQFNIPEKSEIAAESTIIQDENAVKSNKDINNQIENIISDIDINIKAQEKIAQLKEQELQLIQKQKELANQIQQQQLLAQKLIAENQLKEQELLRQKYVPQQQHLQSPRQYIEDIEPTIKQDQCRTAMSQRQEDSNKFQESSNISRTVDLRKIFTPATDAPQILPKNRKLYASSAFYSPTLHPTVEDQVELARRISHSLSDISNQTSKGQTIKQF
ncbi:hypothetical protein AWZ03_011644 [Drosophila navojoa]|uniref:Ionotropic glutamate receptor C-terminal domain-containing protein n=1 Tax=Drosophila navojoa TaxID=7232 RepID=A0A484B269_DRONA|nr:hypothetical protein AWZ03_011644 [Drosophila navojoa]